MAIKANALSFTIIYHIPDKEFAFDPSQRCNTFLAPLEISEINLHANSEDYTPSSGTGDPKQ